jgi:hypothetical protein
MKAFLEFFKNIGGQFSSEELLKVLAGLGAIALAIVFLFTALISVDKASYVMTIIIALLGYALGQGVAHNVTGQ